jgi:hypothetical protein
VIRAHLAHRRADADRRVLAALRHSTPADGYDLWVRTGLRSARLYPALTRLERAGLVVASFEMDPPTRRIRRLYRLACPCGADAVGVGHEPGCREAPPDDNDWLRSEEIRAARPRRAPRMPGGPP